MSAFEKPTKTLTIRGVSPELATALQAEGSRRGLSLNGTVLALLRQALGISEGRPRSNGLRRLAGTWTEEDFREFQRAVKPFD